MNNTNFQKLTPELERLLEKEGYSMLREIPNRGICGLYNFIFTTGLVIGIDQYGYNGRYCFSHPIYAIKALVIWEGFGDPEGDWIKYKGEGAERSNTTQKDFNIKTA